MLNMIVAMENNNVIGYNGRLPWPHLKEDLKNFKKVTTERKKGLATAEYEKNIVVLGYNSLKSISLILGRKENLLPGRHICVLTRDPKKLAQFPGCFYAGNIKTIVELSNDYEIFIAGGAQVYQQFLGVKELKRIIMTRVYGDYDGDTHFPEIDLNDWRPEKHTHIPHSEAGIPAFGITEYFRR